MFRIRLRIRIQNVYFGSGSDPDPDQIRIRPKGFGSLRIRIRNTVICNFIASKLKPVLWIRSHWGPWIRIRILEVWWLLLEVSEELIKGDFWDFSFYVPVPPVRYSTLLHLPPLRFHCVGGCWDRTQDSCDYGIGSNHSARSRPHLARSQRSQDLNRNCQTWLKRKNCNIFPSVNPRKLDLNPDSLTLSFAATDTEIICIFEVLNICASFSVVRSGLLASRRILSSRVATDVQVHTHRNTFLLSLCFISGDTKESFWFEHLRRFRSQSVDLAVL